ncbi:amidohydrolase family protein, partial [Sphingopyxis sp.]|uniref:amidohydrolase family protein n=1 Tax=Sphingopyxis sp. TaxID=1908224 RepID=UPI002ED7F877
RMKDIESLNGGAARVRGKRFRGMLGGALLALAMPVCAAASDGAAAPAAPLVDHHIHLGSDELARQMDEMKKADPDAFEHLSEDIFKKPTPADAIRNLDAAGVKRAVLLSTGYWFMLPGQAADPAEAARKMRAENRFNVETALASKGRIIAFVAINPFAPNAKEEFRYWKGRPGVSGLKLHLGAADFSASSPEQVAQLAEIFTLARKARLPIVTHLRGGGSFTKADVNLFIDKVLSKAGDLPVQIAHGGGYAGADPATIDSLEAFGAAIARKAPGTRNLIFDISGVVMPEEAAAALGSSDAQLALFTADMRQIGLDRFVIGSDWPAIGPIAPYFDLMRRKLAFTDAEWATLCNNVAPYLRSGR